jgi:hypothetical protein
MIDGFIDKIRAELDTRELKDIPTPQLTRMLVYFADLAKKEQPVIEVKAEGLHEWEINRITF